MFFFIFVQWRKEIEKGESSCLAPSIQESGRREISVFVIGLSRNISVCDEALLAGRIGKILASTWSIHLVSDQIYSIL